MKILISGYGKMGKEIEKELKQYELFIVSKENGLTYKDIKEEIDVIIDFSSHEAIYDIKEYLIDKKNTSLIIGTTNYSDLESEVIKEISKNHTVVMFSNFSKGVNLLYKLVEVVSTYLKNENIYLIEKHHKYKKDFPSGTSKTIKEIIDYPINILEIKSGEIIGTHELDVYFENERLSLVHEAFSRKAFVEGVIQAVNIIKNLPIGLYNRENLNLWKETK